MIKTRRFNFRLFLASGLASLLLAACSVLPKAEPQHVYALPQTQVQDQAVPATAGLPWSLRVQTPYSSRMLNSNRIVVRPDHSEISVYKGVRWSDPAPVLLRDRLVDAFRTQSRIAAVSSDSVSLLSDLELGGDLNSFQVEYADGAPAVHIQLDAFLVHPSESRVVASRRFSIEQPVTGKEVPDVVLAFGKAADRLAVDIVAWVLKHSPNVVKGS